jgi:hypothetical protein
MVAEALPLPEAIPTPPDPLRAECLLAVTGLWPTPAHPSANDEIAAMGKLDSYRARLKRWLRAPDAEDYQPRPFDAPEPPDEKALQKRILAPIEGDEEVRLLAGLPDLAEAQMYLDLVKAGRAYLDDHWPKVPVPGISADVFPLSTEELYDVWALARVLDDPDVLFDELEAGSLTIPMVDAWRTVYPTMATRLDAIFEALVIERIAAKKSLTWQQSDLFRMLRGVPLDAVIEIKTDKKADAKGPQQPPQGDAP